MNRYWCDTHGFIEADQTRVEPVTMYRHCHILVLHQTDYGAHRCGRTVATARDPDLGGDWMLL